MASMSRFLSFPPELLIMVLQNMEYKDLIVCSMVCKRFHKLGKEAAELSYAIELAVDGFVDGISDLSKSERLRILLDLRTRWHIFDWLKWESVNPYPTKPKRRNNHYAQGIFSQAMHLSNEEDHYESSMFSTKLPTRATGAVEDGPLAEGSDLWHRAFCMDPAADVVIFVAMEDEDEDNEDILSDLARSRLTIVTRSLSSNGTRRHPLCRSESFEPITGIYDAGVAEPQIAGDIIGVIVTDDQGESVVLFNWHKGQIVIRFACSNEAAQYSIKDFAFLSSRSFVLSTALWDGRTYVERALMMFTLRNELCGDASWLVATGAIKHTVTLLLPELAEGQRPLGYVNTTPCASYQPRGMPFKVENPSRILVYDAGRYDSQSSMRMVIHTDVFAKADELVSGGPDTTVKTHQIPWEGWGPEYSRLFMAKAHDYIDFPQRAIHGERMIMQMTEAGETTTYLMDFNRRAHRRQMASVHDMDITLITEPSILPPSLFAKPITSSLPYTAVRIPDAHLYDGFLLDEQRLLGLKGSRPVEELDVFVF